MWKIQAYQWDYGDIFGRGWVVDNHFVTLFS